MTRDRKTADGISITPEMILWFEHWELENDKKVVSIVSRRAAEVLEEGWPEFGYSTREALEEAIDLHANARKALVRAQLVNRQTLL